ncbi:MAG: hypothetical protein QM730_05260 [Anaerolineales bacterium]
MASLNKVELLPWDCWGVILSKSLDNPDDLSALDEVASLSAVDVPDFETLRRLYKSDSASARKWFPAQLCRWQNGGSQFGLRFQKICHRVTETRRILKTLCDCVSLWQKTLTMPKTKLILFEGIPGSGKSTAATHLEEYLKSKGLTVRFWREGNFDHPADFEGVARLSESGFQALLTRYPEWTAFLHEQLTIRGADYLLKYRKLQHLHPQEIPPSLIDELSHLDVYDGLPMEEYCRLALDRWQDFARDMENSGQITLLECCFLQNPLTVMLARHDADPLLARKQIADISDVIAPLNPLVIYLHPQNVRTALEHVRAERPKEWADFVTWYLTGQAYGKSHDLHGYEGVIQFYEMRQKLEVEILKKLPIPSMVLEHSGADWEHNDKAIINFAERE